MASLTEVSAFAVKRVPEVHFGPGRARAIADDAAALGHPSKPVVLVADRALVELGVAGRLTAALEAAGAEVALFADVDGEPSQRQVEAATDFVRFNAAGLVVCLGGGSAMDIGKVAATIASTGDGPADFAMEARPLPKRPVPKICLPTTAGTGSEFSSTNIFTNQAGKKVWVWGPETKPERVILDPELTTTLPPDLTAWTGLDAFVHALEASTNLRQHPWSNLYAHRALGLIAGALETAVHEPGNLTARVTCCWARPMPGSRSTTAAPLSRTTSPMRWRRSGRCITASRPRSRSRSCSTGRWRPIGALLRRPRKPAASRAMRRRCRAGIPIFSPAAASSAGCRRLFGT